VITSTKVITPIVRVVAHTARASTRVASSFSGEDEDEHHGRGIALAEGFTAAQTEDFRVATQQLAQQLARTSGYEDYWHGINVWRQMVRSNEDGADIPKDGVQRDTAFDTGFGHGGVDRMVCMQTDERRAAVEPWGMRSPPMRSCCS
jgi:hypothetical protein